MFDDIGGKIKTLAKITCGLGIAASIIARLRFGCRTAITTRRQL